VAFTASSACNLNLAIIVHGFCLASSVAAFFGRRLVDLRSGDLDPPPDLGLLGCSRALRGRVEALGLVIRFSEAEARFATEVDHIIVLGVLEQTLNVRILRQVGLCELHNVLLIKRRLVFVRQVGSARQRLVRDANVRGKLLVDQVLDHVPSNKAASAQDEDVGLALGLWQ